jgi:hypothetical protein
MKSFTMRGILRLVVIFCFTSTYVVSYEDDDVSVTVTNLTGHYLHILIDTRTFLYVGPGGRAQIETPAYTAFVEVFYSPGQGISGRATRELTSVTNTTYSGGSNRSCSNRNDKQGCDYSDVTSAEASRTRTPMSWTVYPEDLSADTDPNFNR